ncbi:MAG TPA: nuclear transport factor 2 family protein [Thermoanaerobaculia bacterium]|jgi:ketosteroid isomerase-like protein|nr:nuclear transport factor 2 family protein [Thermoanaerobaculia bacterium]
MNEQANISKMQDMYAAFGRGDINTILQNVTEDCDWGTDTVISKEVPWYTIRQGRDGVGDFFSTLAREVEFRKFVPVSFAAAGDQVFVALEYEYEFRKNGRSAGTAAVHQYTLRDGNVSKFRAFEDTAAVRDAYGV